MSGFDFPYPPPEDEPPRPPPPGDDQPGNLAGLLAEVRAELVRYVLFTTDEAADAVTLWIACTHAQPCWEHATRLVVKSPHKRCGKTRLQDVIGELVHRPIKTTNISVAALVRSIDEDDPPTIMLDEADRVFALRRGERTEGAEDLRGILNSGHSRGWPYVRWDMQSRRREECPTYAMAAIGGIGDFPDTIEDRAVIIALHRRAPGQTVAPFRRKAIPPLRELAERLHRCVQALSGLSEAEPELPAEDRAADTWEPLVIMADAAGKDWPERARMACKVLTGQTDLDEVSAGERLLADLQQIFAGEHCLYSTTILAGGDWYGRELNPRDLAKLLRPYRIKPRDVREHGTGPQRKGYYADDFVQAWSRYVRDTATDDESEQVNPVADDVADSPPVSATWPHRQESDDVADVADVAQGYVEGAPDGRPICSGTSSARPGSVMTNDPQNCPELSVGA